MVARPSVCLRRLARGRRAAQVGFGRFLANTKVTTERLIEGWGAQTAVAVAGRHVLAVHDTSEFNFRTTPKRRRGLGKIGKGGGHGVLLHAMLALDAGTGGCLGLVAGRIWTRRGRVKVTVAAGWTIDIPGSFAEKWDDEGKTWCAWDEGRTIWFTSFALESDKEPARPAEECLELMPLEGEGERFDHRQEHLVGRAIWAPGEEDGEPVWQLQALTATPGGAALLTICVEDPKDKDWAIRAWRRRSTNRPRA